VGKEMKFKNKLHNLFWLWIFGLILMTGTLAFLLFLTLFPILNKTFFYTQYNLSPFHAIIGYLLSLVIFPLCIGKLGLKINKVLK
jgi:hypothetical protein